MLICDELQRKNKYIKFKIDITYNVWFFLTINGWNIAIYYMNITNNT